MLASMRSFTQSDSRWRRFGLSIATATLLSFVAGCSWFESKDADDTKPAKLVDIKTEQRFDKEWSHGVGNGQGKLYARIRPAVVGDRIYAAANNGAVEAFNRITGKSLWNVKIKAPISAGVGAGGGLIVLASNDGRVWGLNADDGKTVWTVAVNSEIIAAPQTDGETVVVVTIDGHLKGLDAKSGSERWSYAATAPALSLRASGAPVIASGLALAGFANGKVIAVTLDNGKPVWEARAAVPKGSSEIERLIDVGSDLVVTDGVLYVVSYQGALSAFDVLTGRKQWEREASSYVGIGESYSSLYVVDPKGGVTAFGKNDQTARWEQTALLRRQLSGAAAWDSFVAIGDIEGYVHLLAQSDGHFVGRERVDSDGVRVQPIAVDDMLYVFGNSGKLAAYKLKAVK